MDPWARRLEKSIRENRIEPNDMKPYLLFFMLVAACSTAQVQTSWKFVSDKNGINIYSGIVENAKYKSIKVETVFDGTINKLMDILGDISKHPEWVYKTKSASIIKKISDYEFVYYTESILPWPLSNRDAIIHLTMVPEKTNDVLRITAISEPDLVGKKEKLVRIPFSRATWYVTESANQIKIEYIFEIDPGGQLPVWLVNLLVDKGPYESFQNLRMMLRR